MDKSHYEIAGVSVGYSMFTELTEELGPSEMSKSDHSSDHSEERACYRNKSQVIEFYASAVGWFGYNVSKDNPGLKNCGVTTRSLKSKFGLELGLEEHLVREMLGKPSDIRDDKIRYIYWVQEKPSKEIQDRENTEYWLDVHSVVGVRVENNLLTHFGVQTEESF